MNQKPVEEHIRGVVKDLLRTRGITKRGLVEDINGTLKIPLKGQKYRLSLQVRVLINLMNLLLQRNTIGFCPLRHRAQGAAAGEIAAQNPHS